ncbi:hypothetical protein MLD38_000213 [Melastoma candidum]|uniref:Uncharacterized protein n=1 Tax=Melastoma candidum TaxID=119954 RepID=A0ACB9S8Q2_9MYRT|nr:hypothetical protein MLD38_000213 [Melastoma candidum]
MMSVEIGNVLPDMGAVTPEKGKGRRYSAGLTRSSADRKKKLPNYLRASTGTCHDLCKYGRRRETETKPWSSGRWTRIDKNPPEKIVTTDEVFPDRKNYLKPKSVSSLVSKGHHPGSSSSGKQKVPSSEKRVTESNSLGKSKASSKFKLSATPSRTSDPRRIVTERASPNVEVSNQVSVKVAERRTSGKLATRSRTKIATAGSTSSSRSLASSGPRMKDRKAMVENSGISIRVRVKNAIIAPTSFVPMKTSSGSVQTSVRRKLWKQKSATGQRDQKIAEDHGIRRIEREVPEKTLYVIGVESNYEVQNLNVREISVENELSESEETVTVSERPPSPSPSPSVAESSSQQNSPTYEERKEGIENSSVQYLHREEEEEEDDDDDDDDGDEAGNYNDDDTNDNGEEAAGSEYSDGELETSFDPESSETQIKEKELTSTVDSIGRRPREAPARVHPVGADSKPMKLTFRRGRVVDIQSDNNTPRRLKFRHRKPLGEDEARTRSQRRVLKKREATADPDDVSNPSSEKYALRSSGVLEKKDGQGALFNNVIEETASKLVETRKSKVKALVGAFETVISLQDGKPSGANTG